MAVSKAEQRASRHLRAVLADVPLGKSIPASELFRDALSGLEYFIPQVMEELYDEWTPGLLDGILDVWTRKTGEGEIVILGICIRTSDQTVTPIHLRLRLAVDADEIAWAECRVGERDRDGTVWKPYENGANMEKRLHVMDGRHDLIDWAYTATVGARRPLNASESHGRE